MTYEYKVYCILFNLLFSNSKLDRFPLGEEIIEPTGDNQYSNQLYDRSLCGIKTPENYDRVPSEDTWIFRSKENSFDETLLVGTNTRPSRISSLPSAHHLQCNLCIHFLI